MTTSSNYQGLYKRLLPLLISPKKGARDNIDSFCPIHEANGHHERRSLSLSPSKGLTCWAGCDFEDIVVALESKAGVQHTNGATPERQKTADGDTKTLVAVYEYRAPDGTMVAEKARFEYETPGEDGKRRKEFKWRLPGSHTWAGLKPLTLKDIPLWGAELLEKAPTDQPVYFCEGEKATQACRDAGLLAVCHGGGSSTREQMGDSLAILKDRVVLLWPDNDPPGRQYMAFVESQIRPLAEKVSVVNVPLPEKGDAADFFGAGGTVEELRSAILYEPAIEFLSDDSVRVRYPTGQGILSCTFDELERGHHSLEAELSLVLERPGERAGSPYTQRINLLSASQVTELRRSLQEVYGKGPEWPWASILNSIVSMVRATYADRDLSVEACEIDDDPDEQVFLVDPLLPLNAPTIFFGDGGSAKTYILLRLLLSMARGSDFLGLTVPFAPVLFIDYEGNAKTFRRRLRRLSQGIGLEDVPAFLYYWPAKGIPLHDMTSAVRKKVEKDGVGLLVIDSVAPALGGKPEDAADALRFFRALGRINCTSALIAHVTKAQGDTHPFGSVFFHNEARATWHVKRAQEEDADDIDVVLNNRKMNDGPRVRPISVAVHFEGKQGPVRMALEKMPEIEELQSTRPLKDRLRDLLRPYPLTVKQIHKMVGGKFSEKVIDNCLRGNKKLFVPVGSVPGGSGRPETAWGLLETQHEE